MSTEPSKKLIAKWDEVQRAIYEAVELSNLEVDEESNTGFMPEWFLNMLIYGASIFIEEETINVV